MRLSVDDRESPRFAVRSGMPRARRSVDTGALGRRWDYRQCAGRLWRTSAGTGGAVGCFVLTRSLRFTGR